MKDLNEHKMPMSLVCLILNSYINKIFTYEAHIPLTRVHPNYQFQNIKNMTVISKK